MDCSPQASLSMGFSQARILEWVAISSSRGSSQLRDQTLYLLCHLHGQADSLPTAPPGKAGAFPGKIKTYKTHLGKSWESDLRLKPPALRFLDSCDGRIWWRSLIMRRRHRWWLFCKWKLKSLTEESQSNRQETRRQLSGQTMFFSLPKSTEYFKNHFHCCRRCSKANQESLLWEDSVQSQLDTGIETTGKKVQKWYTPGRGSKESVLKGTVLTSASPTRNPYSLPDKSKVWRKDLHASSLFWEVSQGIGVRVGEEGKNPR